MINNRRWDYKICPICGAALDIGEICDCSQEKAPIKTAQTARFMEGEYKNTCKGQKRVEGAINRF